MFCLSISRMKFQRFSIIFAAFLLSTSTGEKEQSGKSLSRQKRLIFPQYTVYQISMCLVAQISSLPSHKVAINSGFQLNYAMPFRLRDFYNPMYWARSVSNISNPMMEFMDRLAESESKDDDESDESEDSESNIIDEDDETTTQEPDTMERSKRDLTAGQFYSGLKETLSYSGYHEDCLLKSVCELAAHPLHHDEDNVVNDVLHFILTPSRHQSFDDETENYEKEAFEEAEKLGRSGADCELLYGSNCDDSPLENISRFVLHNEV